jgi:hypothetical protein
MLKLLVFHLNSYFAELRDISEIYCCIIYLIQISFFLSINENSWSWVCINNCRSITPVCYLSLSVANRRSMFKNFLARGRMVHRSVTKFIICFSTIWVWSAGWLCCCLPRCDRPAIIYADSASQLLHLEWSCGWFLCRCYYPIDFCIIIIV